MSRAKRKSADEGYDKPPQIDESFTGVGSNTAQIGKIKLQPYSPERIVAAQAMGRHYGFLDEAGVEAYRKTKLYPGMLSDIINHIWLRSLTDDFEIDRAIRNPLEARKEAIKFANRLKIIDTQGPAFWDAWVIYMDAMGAIRDARAEPAEKKTKPKRGKA